uniref:uncharacterized protein LOC105351030 isoform X2 n=1 Tax=Fragaria vesca subsp. vesca TaxID=101020 RepID=UPI0005CA3B3D|nr:PREDICTED: uncharacterized protein LOC105351030 isoform X2 [Fragaria vesca subsp. vesca]
MRQELDTMASAVSMAANFTFPAVLVNDLSRSFVTSSLMLDAGCGQSDFEREHDSRCWDFETLLADKHKSLLGHVGAESCCYKALETLHRHGPWRLLDITQETGTLTHPLGTEQVVSILVAASLSDVFNAVKNLLRHHGACM